ncbi:MAG: hypothetical protein ABIO70_32215 [Pseudomonadota bacterium]
MDLFDDKADPRRTRRFDDRFLDTLAAQEGVGGEGREVVEEYHLDCQGQKRLFRLEIFGSGQDAFLCATEVCGGEPSGLRLRARFHEGVDPVPWGRLRNAIARRIATRDLVTDPDHGGLHLLTGLIRAQLVPDPADPDGPPAVLVDDLRLSWAQLGRVLSTCEGWGLRIEVTEE